MYRCLSPGAIGVSAGLEEGLRLARLGGFEGLEIGIGDIAERIDRDGADGVVKLFRESGIRPGGWGLPVDWRAADESKYRESLGNLPRLAAAGRAIDCPRVSTWVLSFSDERPMNENLNWHVERFQPIAEILGEHGCSLGLEFLGPKTIWAGHTHEFVRDMNGMLALAERIGPNVGLLLDCWHWYTAGNTVEELRNVSPDRIVYVHVNDAPEGIPIEEQIDSKRRLPGETGVIDIAGFLQALKAIGYDGPITPEPFSEKLRGLSAEDAVRMTGDAMKSVWTKAGL